MIKESTDSALTIINTLGFSGFLILFCLFILIAGIASMAYLIKQLFIYLKGKDSIILQRDQEKQENFDRMLNDCIGVIRSTKEAVLENTITNHSITGTLKEMTFAINDLSNNQERLSSSHKELGAKIESGLQTMHVKLDCIGRSIQ